MMAPGRCVFCPRIRYAGTHLSGFLHVYRGRFSRSLFRSPVGAFGSRHRSSGIGAPAGGWLDLGLDGGISSLPPWDAIGGVSVGAVCFSCQDFNLHRHRAARFAKLEDFLCFAGILAGREQLKRLKLLAPVFPVGLRENPPGFSGSKRAIAFICKCQQKIPPGAASCARVLFYLDGVHFQ